MAYNAPNNQDVNPAKACEPVQRMRLAWSNIPPPVLRQCSSLLEIDSSYLPGNRLFHILLEGVHYHSLRIDCTVAAMIKYPGPKA